MPSCGRLLCRLALLAATMAAATGCRTRLAPEAVVERFTPRVVACADPVAVNVKLEPPAMWVAGGDVDGDHLQDAVVLEAEPTILWGLNGSDFDGPLALPTSFHPNGFVTVADLDGDGHGDVVVPSGNVVMASLQDGRRTEFVTW